MRPLNPRPSANVRAEPVLVTKIASYSRPHANVISTSMSGFVSAASSRARMRWPPSIMRGSVRGSRSASTHGSSVMPTASPVFRHLPMSMSCAYDLIFRDFGPRLLGALCASQNLAARASTGQVTCRRPVPGGAFVGSTIFFVAVGISFPPVIAVHEQGNCDSADDGGVFFGATWIARDQVDVSAGPRLSRLHGEEDLADPAVGPRPAVVGVRVGA